MTLRKILILAASHAFLTFSILDLTSVSSQDTTGFFYCSKAFCEEAIRQKPCPTVRNCSTIGYRTFLDPSECNCCEYCFDYLKENATCSLTSPQVPVEMCGPYLECKAGAEETDPPTCQTITTGPKPPPLDPNFCMTKRKEYFDAQAEGRLGMVQFLPECDAGGKYAPRQCIPGSLCYCSDPEGNMVFGKVLTHQDQDCACARDVARLQSYGFQGRMPHCFPNGDYDELQCVVRTCFCRNFPSEEQHIQNMTKLKCFNESIHVFNPEKTLYYNRPCEMERAYAEIEIAEAWVNKTLMIIGDVPVCDPDGNYGPIQTDYDKQYCADPLTGKVLEGFSVSKISRQAETMNCNCARARYLMRESGTGKPQCCQNGNYRTLQHVGPIWFCVDEYGRQDVSVEPIEVHETLI